MNTIKVYQTPLPRAVALDCAFVGDRKNTLVKAHSTLNRRTLFAGGAALGTAGMLAACSGKNSGSGSTQAAATAGANIADLVKINKQDVSALKSGGKLRLAVTSLGPNFNPLHTQGAVGDNARAISSYNSLLTSGLWQQDYEGKTSPNPDFCTEFTSAMENGKQVLHITLNEKAKFNDGTPLDIEALRATHKVLSDNKTYQIQSTGLYPNIESIEEDGSATRVKVTMSKPSYPIASLFSYVVHPKMTDTDFFANGLVDKPNSDYAAGPFKVAEGGWNSTEKTLTVTRNDKWWGEKPVLESITFRLLDTPAQRSAFANGELDAVNANVVSVYKELENVKNAEFRQGQRLFAGGVVMNPVKVDTPLRRAIMVGLDRKALSDTRFKGLPFNEALPGSRIHMPFSEYYADSMPQAADRKAAAAKILEEAGYTKNGDFYEKDGKRAKVVVNNFSEDNTIKSLARFLSQQLRDLGIESDVDQQPVSNLGKVMSAKEHELSFIGYSVNSDDGTEGTKQFYSREDNDGAGSEEIDAMIEELFSIEDAKERNLKCNEIEKKHMEEFATSSVFYNGPQIVCCQKNLANYGAFLFDDPQYNPSAWSRIGFTG